MFLRFAGETHQPTYIRHATITAQLSARYSLFPGSLRTSDITELCYFNLMLLNYAYCSVLTVKANGTMGQNRQKLL